MKNTTLATQTLRRWMGLKYEPIFAKIEITRRCNLDCEMCVRRKLGEKPDMTFDQFKYIIDNTNFIFIEPHGYGEPLVHPNFIEMMAYCHSKGIRTGLVTNGTLLTKNHAKRYLMLNPKHITFSIDSPYKEEYEKIRKGADFDDVMDNLTTTRDWAKEISPSIIIKIHMTVNKENYESIPAMRKLCKELDVGLEIADITYSYDFRTSKQKYSVRDKFPKNKYRKCYIPWLSTYIDVEGFVYPCTDNLNWKLGNIYSTSIKELYNSEKMQKFRELSVKGMNENCVKCSAWAIGNCPIVKRYLRVKK